MRQFLVLFSCWVAVTTALPQYTTSGHHQHHNGVHASHNNHHHVHPHHPQVPGMTPQQVGQSSIPSPTYSAQPSGYSSILTSPYGHGHHNGPTLLGPGGSPVIHKHIYVHVPPAEPKIHKPKKPYVPPPPPQKHYKIIFIKAPTPPPPEVPDIPAITPPPETKTLVYVLVKKPDPAPPIKIPTPAPTKPSKPEVFFIRYKAPKDGLSDGALLGANGGFSGEGLDLGGNSISGEYGANAQDYGVASY